MAKQTAMEASHKAAKEAIKQGLSNEEVQEIAKEAMIFALEKYKPRVVGGEKAI